MAGFMAGFGTTLSNLIEEDRKYYRDSAAKRRDYIQTYGTRAVVERENQANAAMGTANYLISNGIPQEDVRYVLDTSGVQGIAQLKATLDSRDDLTKDEKAQLVKKAKDYVAKNPEEDLNTVVKRAYGLYKSESNPVKRERSMFSAMMGLDSRMMEDDVLDDMYINGMSGRDIYRIMGSAGPAAGAPIDLNLPSKAPSPTILNNTAKFLESQFETSIDTRINSIRQQMTKVDPKSTEYTTLNDKLTELANLKGKGLLALGTYAAEYDPALFDFARAQEEALPGSITRNSYLFEFLPAYKTHFEEDTDDAKMAEAVKGKPKGIETPKSEVVKFETEQAAIDAAEKGELEEGQLVQVGNNPPVTYTPKGKEPISVDMTGAPGFRERDDIAEEVASIFAPTIPDFVDPTVVSEGEKPVTWQDVKDKAKEIWRKTTEDKGISIAGYTEEAVDAEVEKILADKLDLTEDNYKEYNPRAVGTVGFKDTGLREDVRDTSDVEPDYAAAAQRAPDHVVKLGEQATKMWSDLSEAVTGYQKVAQDARKAKAKVEERKRNMSERETIEDFDRQFIADWKNMPASVKTIVLGSKPKKQGMTEEETIRDLDRQFIKDWEGMPVQNKVIIRDVLYGKRVEEFTDEENKRLNEMREAHPEWFIDTLLDSLDVPTPSEVDTTFKSRTDFGPGIMSRMKPTEPKNVDLEGAPKIGDVEFENMLSRVHGGSSKIVEDFRKKITAGLKAADVTRLIKSTQGLPKTKSRDTLLVSLFDLRDALNKR